MTGPNRLLEARDRVEERLGHMDQAALHRLMAATSIDTSIARLYET